MKKSKKKKKKRERYISSLNIGLFTLLVIIALLIVGRNSILSKVETKAKLIDPTYLYTKVQTAPTVTPSLTPSPTSTPTPTISTITPSLKYFGYCINVPILIYHHVQPYSVAKDKGQTAFTVDSGTFDKQMAYLKSAGYNTISAKQLVEALLSKSALPPKSIVVTLDDGYKDAYTYAFPVFKKYGIIGNLMIPTGLMGGADYLLWSDIEEMGRSGLIFYTDHTWSHYAIGGGKNEKIKFEIETSRQQLEQHTGQKIDLFTYPYGSFSDNAIRILREDGFIAGFSTIGGYLQCDSFIMTLHRNRIGNAPLSFYGL